MPTLPTLFLSHGSPMRAVDPGEAGAAWSAIARALPRPCAVLMVSAHWETGVPMVTANPKPETIHDFGGFPDELYRIRYTAPGAPDSSSPLSAGTTQSLPIARLSLTGRPQPSWKEL